MPDALMNGRFSLYETPEGGFHVAYIADGTEETRHLEIPAMVVKMARLGAEGKLTPMSAMQGLRDMMTDAPT